MPFGREMMSVPDSAGLEVGWGAGNDSCCSRVTWLAAIHDASRNGREGTVPM